MADETTATAAATPLKSTTPIPVPVPLGMAGSTGEAGSSAAGTPVPVPAAVETAEKDVAMTDAPVAGHSEQTPVRRAREAPSKDRLHSRRGKISFPPPPIAYPYIHTQSRAPPSRQLTPRPRSPTDLRRLTTTATQRTESDPGPRRRRCRRRRADEHADAAAQHRRCGNQQQHVARGVAAPVGPAAGRGQCS